MSKTSIFDSDSMAILYYPDKKILVQETLKFTTTEERRKALEAGLKMIEQDRVTKWLTNNKSGSAIPQEDIDWGINEWFPRAIKAGLQYWAVILPEKAVGKLSGKKMLDGAAQHGVSIKTFQTEEAALQWLEGL